LPKFIFVATFDHHHNKSNYVKLVVLTKFIYRYGFHVHHLSAVSSKGLCNVSLINHEAMEQIRVNPHNMI